MPSDKLLVRYQNREFVFEPPFTNMVSSREPAIQTMVKSVVERHDIKEDFWFYVRVKEFAAKYLTRQAAEERIYEIIKECIVSQPIL